MLENIINLTTITNTLGFVNQRAVETEFYLNGESGKQLCETGRELLANESMAWNGLRDAVFARREYYAKLASVSQEAQLSLPVVDDKSLVRLNELVVQVNGDEIDTLSETSYLIDMAKPGFLNQGTFKSLIGRQLGESFKLETSVYVTTLNADVVKMFEIPTEINTPVQLGGYDVPLYVVDIGADNGAVTLRSNKRVAVDKKTERRFCITRINSEVIDGINEREHGTPVACRQANDFADAMLDLGVRFTAESKPAAPEPVPFFNHIGADSFFTVNVVSKLGEAVLEDVTTQPAKYSEATNLHRAIYNGLLGKKAGEVFELRFPNEAYKVDPLELTTTIALPPDRDVGYKIGDLYTKTMEHALYVKSIDLEERSMVVSINHPYAHCEQIIMTVTVLTVE